MPVPATPPTEASLIEAFSSIQGEGILVGCRQIFLRLPNCNLACRYCDTPFSPTDKCIVEDPPGTGELQQLSNPVQLETLLTLFRRWIEDAPWAHHSISLTGGEPLLHADILQHWLPQLRKLLPIYLESNGTLPDQLEKLLPQIDWVSMDIKLQSQTGQATDWETHQRFLQLAAQTNCYVKIVVGENTTAAEIQQAAELVTAVSSEIPLILQPVTIAGKVGVGTRHLLALQKAAARIHSNLRCIPQTHLFLGLM